MVETLPGEQGTRLLLTPNQSLSWRGNILLWIGIAAVCLGVATGMALAGAWVVLPFAGLEVLALAGGFYYTAVQCRRREVLTFSGDELRLEKGIFRKEQEWRMRRPSVRVLLTQARHPWDPPRLHLRHDGEDIPLATFLNREDAHALVNILERQGLTIQRLAPAQAHWF